MSSQPRPSPDFHPDPLDPCPDPKPNPNPITSRGVIEFSTVLINPFLTCSLCNGYFRNAQTISECMHSFCRSCLLKEFYRQTGFAVPRDGDGNNGRGLKGKGGVKCPFPDCFVGCGGDPFENNLILYDYTKVREYSCPPNIHRYQTNTRSAQQELVNKVFPNLIEDDRVAENEFWASRGVKRDDTLASEEGEPPPSHARSAVPPLVHADDELNFVMVPLYPMADSGKFEGKLEMGDPTFPMPVLVKPFLRTSGKLRVFQVKKYLVKKLNLNVKPSDLMVLCNNELMGDEHSLLYLTKTRWVGMNEDLTLKYRLAGAGD